MTSLQVEPDIVDVSNAPRGVQAGPKFCSNTNVTFHDDPHVTTPCPLQSHPNANGDGCECQPGYVGTISAVQGGWGGACSPIIATLHDDPHVTNMRNENFDIMSLGHVSLVQYPREGSAKLAVHAFIEKLGKVCYETYMRSISVSGAWVDAEVSFQVVNDHLQVSTSNEWKAVDESLKLKLAKVDVEIYSPDKVELGVNQTKLTIWTGKQMQWSFLNLKVSGLSPLGVDVGGLLGFDDHSNEDQQHTQCMPKKGKRLFSAKAE